MGLDMVMGLGLGMDMGMVMGLGLGMGMGMGMVMGLGMGMGMGMNRFQSWIMNKSMKLSKQVVSLELAKKLEDLGVNAPSLFKWTDDPLGKPYVVYAQSKDFSYHHPAFTASELMDLLPGEIKEDQYHHYLSVNKYKDTYSVQYVHYYYEEPINSLGIQEKGTSLPDALALLLIHIIEQGYYEPTGTRVL